MNIFIGKTNLDDFKFQILLGKKNFFYDGDLEQGYFIEDIVWRALDELDVLNKNEVVEVLLHYNDNNYYIVFGDENNNGGEETLFFNMQKLKESQMTELLSDQVLNPENIIEASLENGIFYLIEDVVDDEFRNVEVKSLNIQEKKTKTIILKKFFNEQKWNMLGVFLLLTLPYFSYTYINKSFSNSINRKTTKVLKNMVKYDTEKRKIMSRVKKDKTNINALKNSKDLFWSGRVSSSVKRIYAEKAKTKGF